MADKPNQTPEGTEEPPTPEGTEGEITPKEITPAGAGLPPEPEEDYKKKFSESKQEALRIREENKRLQEEKAELEAKLAANATNETLSEEELEKKYPDWDVLTDNEKLTVRNSEDIKRMKEKQAWETDLAKAIQWARENGYQLDPAEFRTFCYKSENIGSKNILSLAKVFVFDQKKQDELPVPPRLGVEKPTGGHTPPDDGKITKEKAEQIRTSNPKLYKQLLLDGRLKAKDIR